MVKIRFHDATVESSDFNIPVARGGLGPKLVAFPEIQIQIRLTGTTIF